MERKDDNLFNRRCMAYGLLIFSVFWFIMVFVTDAWKSETFEVAKIIAYLGVPTTIAGLGFWQYLKAAKHEDEKKKDENLK